MAFDLTNLRSERRTQSEKTARVKLGLFGSVTCNVHDLSVSGAKLELSRPVKKLPKRFQLTLSSAGARRRHVCSCKWQDGNTIGVEFLFD